MEHPPRLAAQPEAVRHAQQQWPRLSRRQRQIRSDSAAALDGTARLKPAGRLVVWLVFLLICVSLIATLPQTLQLLNNAAPPQSAAGDLGFRWLREGMLAAIVVIGTAVMMAKRRVVIDRGSAITSFLILSWLLLVALWSITINDVSALVAALGVRLLQYAPLVLIGYLLTRSAGQAPLALLARLLRWYVLIEGMLAVYQVLGGTRVVWYQTIFGYRAFGTFNNYNAFGPTMAACALLFCVVAIWNRRVTDRDRFHHWMLLAAVLAVMSGSRTAILLSCSIVAYYYFVAIPLRAAVKRVLMTAVPLLALGLYYLANEPSLTGRPGTSALVPSEARFAIWTDHLKAFETPADLVFGVGLGETTMAVGWLIDPSLLGEVARNPHSTYLSIVANFGFVGLAAYIGALALTVWRSPLVLGCVFVVVVAGLSVPLSFLEIFPTNALLLFLWGCVLGSRAWWRTPPDGPQPSATSVTHSTRNRDANSMLQPS